MQLVYHCYSAVSIWNEKEKLYETYLPAMPYLLLFLEETSPPYYGGFGLYNSAERLACL